MSKAPNWQRLEAERQRAAQEIYDRDVTVEQDEEEEPCDDLLQSRIEDAVLPTLRGGSDHHPAGG